MAVRGSSSGMLDIKTPADEFIQYFTREIVHVSDWFYVEVRNQCERKELRFHIEATDLENRTVTMSILGNLVSESYMWIQATITVTPREDMTPTRVAWTVEFEKISHDIEDPVRIVDSLVKHIWMIDVNLYQGNYADNSFNAEFLSHECFGAFIKACKADATVEVVDVDWMNMNTTMSFRSSHASRTNFRTTTTITAEDDDNGSHVIWTIEAERNSAYTNDIDLSLDAAAFIREIFQIRLQI